MKKPQKWLFYHRGVQKRKINYIAYYTANFLLYQSSTMVKGIIISEHLY